MLDATTRLNEDNSQALDIRSDGALLRGRIFRPRGTPKAAVVVHGATGAPAGFYRAFAEWAASERDLAVLTYDYRDFGASARAPVRGSRATLSDWGGTIRRRHWRRWRECIQRPRFGWSGIRSAAFG